MLHSLLTSLLNINSALSPHLAGQLQNLSTWLANSNFDGSKMFSLFHFLIFFTGQLRQFEECSSQYEPLATIEEEGFALHYDGKANDATRDGAGQLRFCLRVATGEIHLRIFRRLH